MFSQATKVYVITLCELIKIAINTSSIRSLLLSHPSITIPCTRQTPYTKRYIPQILMPSESTMPPRDVSPTRPQTPTRHSYAYPFPTSFSRQDQPRFMSFAPAPVLSPISLEPRMRPNPQLPSPPGSPSINSYVRAGTRDDGKTIRPNQESEPETQPQTPNRPKRRPKPLIIAVRKWLTDLPTITQGDEKSEATGEEEKKVARLPNSVPPPQPPRPDPSAPGPTTNGAKKAGSRPSMSYRAGREDKEEVSKPGDTPPLQSSRPDSPPPQPSRPPPPPPPAATGMMKSHAGPRMGLRGG